QEHAKRLLTKEWLAKNDSGSSTPYLMKFFSSTIDLTCCILVTDTRNVWGEVLSSNQFARRWRDCNPDTAPEMMSENEEDSWRTRCLEFMTSVHTIGAFSELSFEAVDTMFSDLAFTLGNEAFRWRWETLAVPPRLSADILSTHLILPLISMTHVAFSASDVVGSGSETGIEKAVDKVGRTARRAQDTHIKNVISKPLIATTLRRITAIFNAVPDLPRVVADAPAPDFAPPSPPASTALRKAGPSSKPPLRRIASPSPAHAFKKVRSWGLYSINGKLTAAPLCAPSTVQHKNEDPPSSPVWPDDEPAAAAAPTKPRPPAADSAPPAGRSPSPPSPGAGGAPSSSPLPPPPKKAKRGAVASSSSEDESEEERKKHLARMKAGSSRGAKQPLKRGGKRF
ncbi:uncharacterized protein BXZ73DRAFT_38484, partial [Epithele typhae]|uniref:uncharacterized protein n=1 Tax=Epithele typhae TaxID=378194 RepID=UPI002007B691